MEIKIEALKLSSSGFLCFKNLKKQTTLLWMTSLTETTPSWTIFTIQWFNESCVQAKFNLFYLRKLNQEKDWLS